MRLALLEATKSILQTRSLFGWVRCFREIGLYFIHAFSARRGRSLFFKKSRSRANTLFPCIISDDRESLLAARQ